MRLLENIKNVVLYTIDCPKCKVLEQKLKSKNIKYKTFTDVNEMIRKGLSTMPMLEVDGNILSFSEAVKWVNEV